MSVRTTQETRYVSATDISQLISIKATITLYFENHTKQKQKKILLQNVVC
jgi:hypothetical protein